MEETDAIIGWLRRAGSSEAVRGMTRFGISAERTLGVSVALLRVKAREYRRRNDIAAELWDSGWHEARILASMIADPARFGREEMDRWVAGFDSWDVCDQCCMNLFRKTPVAVDKVGEYVTDSREFVRRAGFVLMAVLAVHDRKLADADFERWLAVVAAYASDDRNFVRKAVCWALRQIGKRNLALNAAATAVARELAAGDDKTARRTGREALRELTSPKTLAFISAHRR